MKLPSIINRNKPRAVTCSVLFLMIAYGYFIEPEWVVVRHISLSSNPKYRLVHITDIHYRGDESYFTGIVDRINRIAPDFVCFTGDLVDDRRYLKEALRILQKIHCPIFGIPGNHEYWIGFSSDEMSRAFRSTGGDWLENRQIRFGDLEIVGMVREEYPKPSFVNYSAHHTEKSYGEIFKSVSGEVSAENRLLLIHYPSFVEKVPPEKFDLILAGHSHGGQVRVPAMGALMVPYEVGMYEKGLFETEAGTLYVNPGIGTYGISMRLFCRPEITVITF